MKPIDKLTNVERARLLFELFPGEIKLFINFTKDFTQEIIDNPEKLKNETVDQMHTTDFWQELVYNAKARLDKYGDNLANRRNLFSDQLFDGYDLLYARFCLQRSMTNEQCNRKFKQAVMLLFF